jgi:hypothetical protein
LLALGFTFLGCITGNGNDETYAIGDTGPAGGTVFYDKGSYSDGWRYLEATPDVPEFYDSDFYNGPNYFFSTNWIYHPYGNVLIDGTDTAIGRGKQNTEILVAYFGSMGEAKMYPDGFKPAAKLCVDLNYGGKTDWFLPSKDELNQMYLNLKGYHDVRYNFFWSSSQAEDGNVWLQNLGEARTTDDMSLSAGQQFTGYKGYEFSVRAVRYF